MAITGIEQPKFHLCVGKGEGLYCLNFIQIVCQLTTVHLFIKSTGL